ncbi:uncharacterized protein EDB91DRAFT_1132823 [Suillus paluster]|uniref:uncharacterized protein n=1 Tax=Suillus paluster TaxID=48578 RepID=UPI001B8624F1|nr:uncharacterized protein EDB91DRAFT_1132823 [Suillus paluster]KAG1740499.1 hypothetical protein EDB91DRAFT_1132823 [Suillus paluster]
MMNAFKTLVSLAFLVSTHIALVQAAIYVTDPVQSTVCSGGQGCQVEWVDDGQSPLLDSIGECTVGLYNGEMLLAQSLTSVNVATTNSFSFTPNPSAGANGAYYLVFTSNGITYQGWSGTFTLNGMTGTTGGSSGSATSGTSTTVVTSTSVLSSGSPTSTITDTSTTATTLTTPTSSGTLTSSTATAPTSVTTTHTTTTSSATTTPSSGAVIRAGASNSLAGGLILALAGAIVF